MDDLNLFNQLKKEVLSKYLQTYPFWDGTLENFGNKEIAQLQDLIESDSKQRISEKWMYTHLKPVVNSRLPRKDMLDILSKWVGYSGWDEFRVKEKVAVINSSVNPALTKAKIITVIVSLLMIAGIVGIKYSGVISEENECNICFYDKYTQKAVSGNNLAVFLINEVQNPIKQKIDKGCLTIITETNEIYLKVESPYYKDIELKIEVTEANSSIFLQPDDYAMMLRMCMNSEKDWEKRRKQLEEIIIDEAEIVEVMYEDIGVEFLNKEEFIDKITIPIQSTKTMEIIDIKYGNDGRIEALKFIQKNEN